ncbi:Neurotrophin receptor-interacting factor -like protein, partial [Trichinella zimbabwensis]
LIFYSLGVVESDSTMLPFVFDPPQYTCRYCPARFENFISCRNHMSVHQGMRPFVCNHCGRSFADAGEKEEHVKTHLGAELSKSSSSLESYDMKRLFEEPLEQEDKADRDAESSESLAVKIVLKEEVLRRMMNLSLSSPVKLKPLKQEYCISYEPSVKLCENDDGNSKTQLNDAVGRSETQVDGAQLIQENNLGATEKIYQNDCAIDSKRQVVHFPAISIERIDETSFPNSVVGDKVTRNCWKSGILTTDEDKAKNQNPLPAIRLAIRKYKVKGKSDYESFTVEERFQKAQLLMKKRFKREKKVPDQTVE